MLKCGDWEKAIPKPLITYNKAIWKTHATATTVQSKQSKIWAIVKAHIDGIRQIFEIAKANPKAPPVDSAKISENRIKISILFLPWNVGIDLRQSPNLYISALSSSR